MSRFRENIFGYRVRIQTPFTTVRTIIGPPYPDPLGGGRAGRPRQDPIEFELSTPYLMRYHLMLEQALGPEFGPPGRIFRLPGSAPSPGG